MQCRVIKFIITWPTVKRVKYGMAHPNAWQTVVYGREAHLAYWKCSAVVFGCYICRIACCAVPQDQRNRRPTLWIRLHQTILLFPHTHTQIHTSIINTFRIPVHFSTVTTHTHALHLLYNAELLCLVVRLFFILFFLLFSRNCTSAA